MRTIAMALAGVLIAACSGGLGPGLTVHPGLTANPGSTAAPTTPGSSGTQASATDRAILVGAGDIASCSSPGDEATAALLDDIDGAVFTAGDNAYHKGSPAEFADCYAPTWGRALGRTLPAPGNHDYNTADATGYFAYFGAAAGNPAEGWYARGLGAWRIYVLNSNCSAIGGCEAGSRQEVWLRGDLAANLRTCAMAIWHHPLFSSGEHGGSTASVDLWQALQDAGAEVVVNGHDHDYERFAPQDADGVASAAGLVEFVAGTGGKSHYRIDDVIANSMASSDDTFGVLQFELYPDSWASTFLPVAGGSFTDSSAGACH